MARLTWLSHRDLLRLLRLRSALRGKPLCPVKPSARPRLEHLEDRLAPANLTGVADALSHSPEYYSNLIGATYQTYLNRAPATSEVSGWLAGMQNGLSDEQLEAGFIGSPEYIANHGGQGAG